MRNGKLGPVKGDDVKDLEASAPPVPAAEALRRNLLYAMFGALSADDMDAVVRKQVEKAKEGDHRAAKLLIDMVQAGPAVVAINQASASDGSSINFLSGLRVGIVHAIAAEGPMKASTIGDRLGVPVPRVQQAMDCDWFEKEPDGYHLTRVAYAEVIERARGE